MTLVTRGIDAINNIVKDRNNVNCFNVRHVLIRWPKETIDQRPSLYDAEITKVVHDVVHNARL